MGELGGRWLKKILVFILFWIFIKLLIESVLTHKNCADNIKIKTLVDDFHWSNKPFHTNKNSFLFSLDIKININ